MIQPTSTVPSSSFSSMLVPLYLLFSIMQVEINQSLTISQQDSMKGREGGLRVVLLGPPGCGKGTQAAHIQDAYKCRHLSTGDMLRKAVSDGSRSGEEAKRYMLQGQLVPDEIVNKIVFDAILATNGDDGFILDGFPRNVAQAEALDDMLRVHEMHLDAAIEFAIGDSMLKERILGRLIHPPSGRTYHTTFRPPRHPMRDDITGDKLVRRPDDNEETLAGRLRTYREETKPVLDYYDQKGILRTVDARRGSQEVWGELRAIFETPERRRQSH